MFTKVKKTKNAFPNISYLQHERGKLISEINFIQNYLTLLTMVILKNWSRTMYEVERCNTRTTYDVVALSNTYQNKEETADT